MKYSPSAHAFYPPEIRYSTLPDDLIDVPLEDVLLAMNRAPGESFSVVDGRVLIQPVAPPALTVAQRIAALLAKVDERLNTAARARGYDSIITASLRAGFDGPFHDEGVAYATWMDFTYAKCYEVLAQWEAGEIEEPTAPELLAMLPEFALPGDTQ